MNILIRLIIQMLQRGGGAANVANNAKTEFQERYDSARNNIKSNVNLNIPKVPKWISICLIAIVIVVFIGVLIITIGSNLGTDIMWYSELGFGNVLYVQYLYPVFMFLCSFVIVALLIFIALTLCFNVRPKYQVANLSIEEIETVKKAFTKHKKLYFAIISVIIAAIFAFIISSNTITILQMLGSESFNQSDPIFHIDASFYVFVLPGIEFIVGVLTFLFIVILALVALFGASFGQVGLNSRKTKFGRISVVKVAKPLRSQLSIYASITSLLLAVTIYLSRYDLLTKTSDRITGASWTDVNVRIPAIEICFYFAIVVAILFVICAFIGKIKLPLIAISAFLLIGVIASSVVPVIVQNVVVNPNAQEKEKEFIAYNITATRNAFGINDVQKEQYNATTDAKSGQLAGDAESTTQIRLLDPQITAPTFRQLQQNKQYYSFPDTLSVDKYSIDGKSHDTVIAAREIDLTGNDQRNWVNDHTVYTHGFGLVAAYGNTIGADGRPQFYEKDIPTDGKLSESIKYEPRIYFSKNAPEYSIVGSSDEHAWEFDYPEAKQNTTFSGEGGPKINNTLTKLLYAFRFGDYQLFFSDRINSNSQILYWRDPETRLKKVAPYLEPDGRVYPAVVDGKVKWILDAYTTTDRYPYSKEINMKNVTRDTVTETSRTVNSLNSQTANYIRNSVKATVDAYDGKVTLYAWDVDDPILKMWAKIYNQELHSISEISGDLMSHIRYPENLFKIQRSMLENYHVDSPSAFFSGEDFWQVPGEPTTAGTVTNSSGQKETNVKQPPYYLTLQMPGNTQPTFSLTSSFIPGGGSKREILTGFLSADSDAGNKAGVKGDNYGKLHLLELPKNTTVPGPGQAQNNFNANADVSKELNLLSGNSSSIIRGNLLTLPVGGGLIYVQPVYVQSTGTTSFPLLKKVLVAFGDKVGFSDTLAGALNQVFGGNSGAKVSTVNSGDLVSVDSDGTQVSNDTSSQSQNGDFNSQNSQNSSNDNNNGGSGDSSQNNQTALENARKALDQAIKALQDAQKALESAGK